MRGEELIVEGDRHVDTLYLIGLDLKPVVPIFRARSLYLSALFGPMRFEVGRFHTLKRLIQHKALVSYYFQNNGTALGRSL